MTLHLGIDIGVQGASTNPARFWGSTTCRRWPGHASLFARVRDDGRAKAALIAGLLRKGAPP